jgi:gliding motility-associated-like protein
MENIFTPGPFRALFLLTGFALLLLSSSKLGAQCSGIDQVSFTPADTVHCGFPLSVDFQSAIAVDSTPVFLSAQNSSANFKSNFSFSFPRGNNGCYYYLEIEGYFTLWSNTPNHFDAYGLFNLNTNQLISPGVSNNLSITTPLFVTPAGYSGSHVYRYYYLGNGAPVTVSFNDNQPSDNSGAMTFSWHVVPCFTTAWTLGDGATSNQPNPSHTYANPGAYPVTLTVTNNLAGCSDAFSGSVTLLPTAQTQLSATICAGDSYQLGNNTYTETGTYTEVLSTWLGCDSTVTLNLVTLAPVASISPPNIINCNNPTVALNGSGSSGGAGVAYQWTGPGAGCIAGSATQPSITASCPGTYTLQATQTAADGTQCSATAQATVLEDTQPPLIELAETAEIPCGASDMTLTAVVTNAGASPTYNWQTTGGSILSGANTPVLSIGGPGVYQFTAANPGNGCSASAEVVVTGSSPMELSWEALSSTCLNPMGAISISVDAGGEPPFLYSIDGGGQFQPVPVFAGLDAGPYAIVVQDALGCETEAIPVALAALTPVTVDAGADAAINAGEPHPLQAWINLPPGEIDSIRWTPAASLSCSDCLNPLASPATNTEYLVEVWDVNGCYASATVRVLVSQSEVYAPNIFSPNGDGINDEFLLYSRPGSVARVRALTVFNRWGQPVFHRSDFLPNDPKFGWDGRYGGTKLDAGVYAWLAEIEMADGAVEMMKGGVGLVR